MHNLNWWELAEVYITAEEHKRAAERLELQANAFVAWRQETLLSSMFAGKVQEGTETFAGYLDLHNLLTPAERKAAAKAKEERRAARRAVAKAAEDRFTKAWEAQLK